MAWGRLCVCALDLQVLHYCFLILQGQPLRDSVVAALANHEVVMFVRVERAKEADTAAGLCFHTVEVTAPTGWTTGGMSTLAGMLWEDFTNTGVPEVLGYSVTHKLGTGATSIVYCAVSQAVPSGESGGAAGAGGAGAGAGDGSDVGPFIAVKTARPRMGACLMEERAVLERVAPFDKLRRVVRIACGVEASVHSPSSPSHGRGTRPSAGAAVPATLCLVPVCNHFKHSVGGPHFSLRHALQFLEGLEVIHSANLVHRDCRASNIMVNPNGDLIVGDLGFAVEVRCPWSCGGCCVLRCLLSLGGGGCACTLSISARVPVG